MSKVPFAAEFREGSLLTRMSWPPKTTAAGRLPPGRRERTLACAGPAPAVLASIRVPSSSSASAMTAGQAQYRHNGMG
jgi:hypothetical protein